MIEIAIVGGGPGGLMAAKHIEHKIGYMSSVTIFEATDRLGGKMLTETFSKAPAMYEAGVAEFYDYSHLGPDPLKELIQSFGFETVPMDSDTVCMDGHILNNLEDVRSKIGAKTADSISDFRAKCASILSPAQYYEGAGKDDNDSTWLEITEEELLNLEVSDPTARKFFRIAARSDIATDAHLTNGLNSLKNFLMDVDGYIGLYSIIGGNDKLVKELAARARATSAKIALNTRVLKIGKTADGRYRLTTAGADGVVTKDFDFVVISLPHNWLSTVEFEGEELRQAMSRHVAYFDRPAHYLRISLLFKTPFWRDKIKGAWFMSDAFGGCCVYDEGARHEMGPYGVLNWLVAGNDVLAYANLSDEALTKVALDTLPPELQHGRDQLMEMRSHRWLSSVNGIPGGVPVRDPRTNHIPEPKNNAGIVLTGDYLFDSTLNGLLDSADIASDMVLTQLIKRRYAQGLTIPAAQEWERKHGRPPLNLPAPSLMIDRLYFDNYRGVGAYADVWHRFSDPQYYADLFKLVWNKKPKKLLVTGSASGEFVGGLRGLGIDAYGIENNRYIHNKTPTALKDYNILGNITDMPFKDNEFDFVIETALCHVNERFTPRAIRELHRVTGAGLIFATVTSDLTSEIIDKYDLMRGVKSIASWWEWSEMFFDRGFELALEDQDMLETVWQRTLEAGRGPDGWYEDDESMRYCFYNKVELED